MLKTLLKILGVFIEICIVWAFAEYQSLIIGLVVLSFFCLSRIMIIQDHLKKHEWRLNRMDELADK